MPRRKSDRLRRERELADAIAAKVPRFNAHQVDCASSFAKASMSVMLWLAGMTSGAWA